MPGRSNTVRFRCVCTRISGVNWLGKEPQAEKLVSSHLGITVSQGKSADYEIRKVLNLEGTFTSLDA